LKLSRYFGDKSAREYSRISAMPVRIARVTSWLGARLLISELKDIRKFPIFNLGKYKGGLIVVQQNKRILPFRFLAERTIGYKNENVKTA
jgi:cell division protein FtsI (penicillin-binding protein 3)